MKRLLLITVLALLVTDANAIWLTKNSYIANSAEDYNFRYVENKKDKHVEEKNKKLSVCYNNCSINVDLLRQCREQSDTKEDRASCINFSKRECLMKCKEKELNNINIK